MDHISYTAARAKLARTMDRVNEDRTALLITRQRGKSAVLVSEEEYASLLETAHLLASPANAARLAAAHEQIEKEIARRARRPRRPRR